MMRTLKDEFQVNRRSRARP